MNKLLILSWLLCSAAQGMPLTDGRPEFGKKLFDHYNCNKCHNKKMGGDGNTIFTRPNRKVTSQQQLSAQIEVCTKNVGADLSAQEKIDLTAYLNQNFYKFK